MSQIKNFKLFKLAFAMGGFVATSSCNANSAPITNQNSGASAVSQSQGKNARENSALQISVSNLNDSMNNFTKSPHYMGSTAQIQYGEELREKLMSFGWKVEKQEFEAIVPNINHITLGGKESVSSIIKKIKGINIVASLAGNDNCVLILGGHYDTKYFKEFHFVGANDGGSSTVLQLELARILSEKKKLNPKNSTGKWRDCTLVNVFFDGEEAQLSDWYSAENDPKITQAYNALLNQNSIQKTESKPLEDHLYGSTAFANSLTQGKGFMAWENKPIAIAIVIDMIGHKNQNIFITQGSNPQVSDRILALKDTVKISRTSEVIQDDHIPLKNKGINVVHMIDWTNIADHWHRPSDNIQIISTQKIANFGEVLLRFMDEQK